MAFILKTFLRDQGGATATEYALIASGLAIGSVAAVQTIGQEVNTSFTNVGTAIGTGNTP